MRATSLARVIALASASAAAVAAVALVSGCSTNPAAAPSAEADVAFEHIHALVPLQDEGSLLVGTHEGLYRLTIESGGGATATGPIGDLDFDPMGFTVAAGTAYASGHPGPTTPDFFGSPNLGLITSTDLGNTWTNVSLTGVTDFHGLTVMVRGDGQPQVFGIDPSRERIQRSLDGGLTWSEGAALVARDIVAFEETLYATTPEGLAISEDGGMTFRVDSSAPSLYLLAAGQAGTLAGIDTSGTLWTRSTSQTWVSGGSVAGTPQALAVDGARIFVADDRGIGTTDDVGATWTVLNIQR
ncbi:MAG: hypothetical protein ABIQ01_12875 [Pseudolysinimonas sp.]